MVFPDSLGALQAEGQTERVEVERNKQMSAYEWVCVPAMSYM